MAVRASQVQAWVWWFGVLLGMTANMQVVVGAPCCAPLVNLPPLFVLWPQAVPDSSLRRLLTVNRSSTGE